MKWPPPALRARWLWMVAAGLAGVALAVGITAGGGGAVTADAPAATTTARIVKTTLLDARTATGTLGFGDPVDVQFISRARSGIVTWIAPEGSVVARGQALFAIDGQPVVLLYGELPFFRSLRFHGHEFTDFDWLELNNARDDEARAELNLAAQRARLNEAQVRLEEIRVHVADSERAQPQTPQFIRLQQAVAAARDRLHRIEQLADSRYASPAELQQARYELAAAQAEADAAQRERSQQLAAAETVQAEARLAVQAAERTLRDAHDATEALRASANDNRDIELLRENLAALGFKGGAMEVIRRWQHQAGRSATGLVEPGHVVVAPGPVRVAAHLAEVGAVVYSRLDGQSAMLPSGNNTNQIVRYTGTERMVKVSLELADHDYARPGDAVTVTLPTNATVEGVINKVSTVFDNEGRADAQIGIPAQQELGSLEAASVEVEFVVGKRTAVLAVPVAALLALPGGGYGVEVVEGTTVRTVPVVTGLFAGGNVEISGEGIAEGMAVRVPK